MKIWLFRLICLVVIPILSIGLLEGGLRIAGYGYPTGAIVRHALADKDVYAHNYQFGWRFFPRNIARDFDGFVFETNKPPSTYRIFVLGASAAMGMPAPSYNFGRILEAMLNDMYPEIDFEVHTAAMVAINSHVVLEIVEDCARYEPDLFLVYLGNNEVVGPFGPGTVFSPLSPSLPLIRANLAVKSTRTGQLMEHLFNAALPRDRTPQRWGGLEMFLEKQLRHDNPALATVYSHFAANLQDICNTARKSGAAVIVSNVACNLKDSPPFASLHRTDMSASDRRAWKQIYQRGIEHEEAGRYAHAIAAYQEAAEIDATFADVQFRLGRCCREEGRLKSAKDCFQNALLYDTLRFRANAMINRIIRTAAAGREEENIYFVDSAAYFEKHSPDGIPGAELFYEHVHFNFRGNYLLARALFSAIQNVLPEEAVPQRDSPLTSEQAARRLAYTDFERHHFLLQIYDKMLDKPPFTNQLYHDEFMQNTKQQIDALAARLEDPGINDCANVHREAIRQHPDDWHLHWRQAILLGNALNDMPAQEQHLRRVIALCPYDSACLKLGKNLRSRGRMTEARDVLLTLLRLKPNSGRAHVELALLYQQTGNTEKYIEHLAQSLAIDPASSIDPYGALAEAYQKTGKTDKAIQTLYRATHYFPRCETAHVHATLAYLLNSQGKYEKAGKELQIALQINPDFAHDKLFQQLLADLESKTDQ